MANNKWFDIATQSGTTAVESAEPKRDWFGMATQPTSFQEVIEKGESYVPAGEEEAARSVLEMQEEVALSPLVATHLSLIKPALPKEKLAAVLDQILHMPLPASLGQT